MIPLSRRRRLAALAVVALALLVSSGIASARGQRQAAASPRQQQFAAAAREFNVPEPVLLALSYVLTRWEPGHGQADASGGYGPMHLTFLDGQAYAQSLESAGVPLRDTLASIARAVDADTGLHTLEAAATMLSIPPGQVSRDPRQNIRAGAALLASYAGADQPAELGGWYDAAARYVGGGSITPASRHVADAVFATLRSGARRTTSDGQQMTLAAQSVRASAAAASRAPAAQCPAGLACQFVAAAHDDPANRAAGQVRYIVIGSAGAAYDQAVARMADPSSFTSSHYLVSGVDGQVTQLVRTSDVAWYAADTTVNGQAVTIALDQVSGASGYSDATYASVAALVKYLASAYQIPLDRQHVLGRDELPAYAPAAGRGQQASTRAAQAGQPMADDPGPSWDWGRLFSLVGASLATPSDDFGHAVAFLPDFGQNLQLTTVCAALGLDCGALTSQPVNFVPLRSAPSDAAPLLSDPRLHPDGGPGSADLGDTGDKAVAGQVFALAERSGEWTAVWYGGQRGWFREAPGLTRTVRNALVTPAAGLGSVEVYAAPGQPASRVYRIQAGQSYPLLATLPNGFDMIGFNHQLQYVRSSAVSVWPG